MRNQERPAKRKGTGKSKKLVRREQTLQCGDQLGSRAGFADKSVRAQQPDGCLGLGCAILHSQEQDLGRRSDATYLEGGGDAIHHRHVDVQKHQFGSQRLYLIDGLLAVFGFAANGEGIRVQKLAHRTARDVMIVDEQDSRRKSPVRLRT
jgi:hypothetical protein